MQRLALSIWLVITAWLLPLAASAATLTVFHGTNGQTLYIRVQTGAAAFKGVALTEGSSGGLGVYTVDESSLVSAGISTSSAAAGYVEGFPFTVRSGSASDTANDPIVGQGILPWSASAALPTQSDARLIAGNAVQALGGYIKSIPENSRIWFVSTTGNDSNAGTRAAPFLTIGAAVTASTSGDTIRIRTGTFTLTSTVGTAKRLTYEGDTGTAISPTIVTSSTLDCFAPASGSTIRNMKITNTTASPAVFCVNLQGKSNVTLENVILDAGQGYCVVLDASAGTVFKNVSATTTGHYAVAVYGDSGATGVNSALTAEHCAVDPRRAGWHLS